MAVDKKLEKVKHAQRILDCIGTGPKIFAQVYCETSIDQNTVQTSLAKLIKLGYVRCDPRGRYELTEKKDAPPT